MEISVVIPVYNGAVYLPEAIQSVIRQTRPAAEIILVDDGSEDNSAAIARQFGPIVRCIETDHAGPAAARNQGVIHSTGDWLAFLDADDLWSPEKLEQQVAAVEAQPSLEAVLGMIESFISPDLDPLAQRRLFLPAQLQVGYHAGTLLIRRDVFLSIGQFNPVFQSGEFADWWARATDCGLIFSVLSSVVMRRRLHGQNHTLLRSESLQDYARVARMALNRRRQGL